MIDLIERLGKLTGPDRELDSLIARSLETLRTEPFKGNAPSERLEGMYWVFGSKDTPTGPVEEKWSKNPPLYTFSIDAALTLVPEGYATDITIYASGQGDATFWSNERKWAGTWPLKSRPANSAHRPLHRRPQSPRRHTLKGERGR